MKEIEINKIPSPTWSWLKINGKKITLPSFTEAKPEIKNEDAASISEGVASVAEKGASACNGDGSTTENASTCEPTSSNAPISGVGKDFSELTESTPSLVIKAGKGKEQKTPLVLKYKLNDKDSSIARQTIIAEEGSSIKVIILSESEKNAEGFEALKTTIKAEKNAKVQLFKVQLLGDGFTQIDDTETLADESASIQVNHIILGGKNTFMGTGSSLSGWKASFKSELSYFADKERLVDLNYIVRHFGKKSECLMNVYGTLRDKAEKNYRGTIDFKNGCAGSVGEETEDALLLSPLVKNNSIPVILCDEEDVQGEHLLC